MRQRRPFKPAAWCAGLYFFTNVLFVHAGEASLWEERRRHAQRSGADGVQVAGLPVDALSALPALSRVSRSADLPASEGSPAAGGPAWLSSLSEYGTVRAFHPARDPHAPLIIHIQDAHEVEEAQRNMAAMIQTLSGSAPSPWRGEGRGEGGHAPPLLVGLEGASGAFAVEAFRAFPNKDITRGLADHFLKDGTLGGPEYAALVAPEAPLLWGVEARADYDAHVRTLLEARRLKPALEDWLAEARAAAEKLKAKTYSPALQEFDRRAAAYHSHAEGLGEYASFLGSFPGGDAFPNVTLFQRAVSLEKTLDFSQLEKDRRLLVETLARRLPRAALDALVQKSLDLRLGRAGTGDYHRFLRNLCRDYGVDLDAFGRMGAYIDYVLLADRIDRDALLDELTRREIQAQDSLALTPEQKRLTAAVRRLALLEGLSRQAMTPQDWAAYEKERPGVLRLPEELGASSFPVSLTSFEDFCRLALKRNEGLVDNLLAKMKERKAPSAVLVAGGFHTEGLTDLLRRRGASWAVVAPRLLNIPEGHDSLEIFTRELRPLEKIFAGEPISLRYTPTLSAGSHTPQTRSFSALFTAAQKAIGQAVGDDLTDEELAELEKRLPLPLELKAAVRDEGGFTVHTFDGTVDGQAVSCEAVVTTREKLAVLKAKFDIDAASLVEVDVEGTPYVMAVFRRHPLMPEALRQDLRDALRAASLWRLVWEEGLEYLNPIRLLRAHDHQTPLEEFQRGLGILAMVFSFFGVAALPLFLTNATPLVSLALLPVAWLATLPTHWLYDRLALQYAWAPLMAKKKKKFQKNPIMSQLQGATSRLIPEMEFLLSEMEKSIKTDKILHALQTVAIPAMARRIQSNDPNKYEDVDFLIQRYQPLVDKLKATGTERAKSIAREWDVLRRMIDTQTGVSRGLRGESVEDLALRSDDPMPAFDNYFQKMEALLKQEPFRGNTRSLSLGLDILSEAVSRDLAARPRDAARLASWLAFIARHPAFAQGLMDTVRREPQLNPALTPLLSRWGSLNTRLANAVGSAQRALPSAASSVPAQETPASSGGGLIGMIASAEKAIRSVFRGKKPDASTPDAAWATPPLPPSLRPVFLYGGTGEELHENDLEEALDQELALWDGEGDFIVVSGVTFRVTQELFAPIDKFYRWYRKNVSTPLPDGAEVFREMMVDDGFLAWVEKNPERISMDMGQYEETDEEVKKAVDSQVMPEVELTGISGRLLSWMISRNASRAEKGDPRKGRIRVVSESSFFSDSGTAVLAIRFLRLQQEAAFNLTRPPYWRRQKDGFDPEFVRAARAFVGTFAALTQIENRALAGTVLGLNQQDKGARIVPVSEFNHGALESADLMRRLADPAVAPGLSPLFSVMFRHLEDGVSPDLSPAELEELYVFPITALLAHRFIPAQFPGLTPAQHWVMARAAVAGFSQDETEWILSLMRVPSRPGVDELDLAAIEKRLPPRLKSLPIPPAPPRDPDAGTSPRGMAPLFQAMGVSNVAAAKSLSDPRESVAPAGVSVPAGRSGAAVLQVTQRTDGGTAQGKPVEERFSVPVLGRMLMSVIGDVEQGRTSSSTVMEGLVVLEEAVDEAAGSGDVFRLRALLPMIEQGSARLASIEHRLHSRAGSPAQQGDDFFFNAWGRIMAKLDLALAPSNVAGVLAGGKPGKMMDFLDKAHLGFRSIPKEAILPQTDPYLPLLEKLGSMTLGGAENTRFKTIMKSWATLRFQGKTGTPAEPNDLQMLRELADLLSPSQGLRQVDRYLDLMKQDDAPSERTVQAVNKGVDPVLAVARAVMVKTLSRPRDPALLAQWDDFFSRHTPFIEGLIQWVGDTPENRARHEVRLHFWRDLQARAAGRVPAAATPAQLPEVPGEAALPPASAASIPGATTEAAGPGLPAELAPIYYAGNVSETFGALDELANQARAKGRPLIVAFIPPVIMAAGSMLELYQEYAAESGLSSKIDLFEVIGNKRFKEWIQKRRASEYEAIREKVMSGSMEAMSAELMEWVTSPDRRGVDIRAVPVLPGNVGDVAWESFVRQIALLILSMRTNEGQWHARGPRDETFRALVETVAEVVGQEGASRMNTIRRRLVRLAEKNDRALIVPVLPVRSALTESPSAVRRLIASETPVLSPFDEAMLRQTVDPSPISDAAVDELYHYPLHAALAEALQADGYPEDWITSTCRRTLDSLSPDIKGEMMSALLLSQKGSSSNKSTDAPARIVRDSLKKRGLWPARPAGPAEGSGAVRGVEAFLDAHAAPASNSPATPQSLADRMLQGIKDGVAGIFEGDKPSPRLISGPSLPEHQRPVFHFQSDEADMQMLSRLMDESPSDEVVVIRPLEMKGITGQDIIDQYASYKQIKGAVTADQAMEAFRDEAFMAWFRARTEPAIRTHFGEIHKKLEQGDVSVLDWPGLSALVEDQAKKGKRIRVVVPARDPLRRLWDDYHRALLDQVLARELVSPRLGSTPRELRAFAEEAVSIKRQILLRRAQELEGAVRGSEAAYEGAVVIPMVKMDDGFLLDDPKLLAQMHAAGTYFMPLTQAALVDGPLSDELLEKIFYAPLYAAVQSRMNPASFAAINQEVLRAVDVMPEDQKAQLMARMIEYRRKDQAHVTRDHFSLVPSAYSFSLTGPFNRLPEARRGLAAFISSSSDREVSHGLPENLRPVYYQKKDELPLRLLDALADGAGGKDIYLPVSLAVLDVDVFSLANEILDIYKKLSSGPRQSDADLLMRMIQDDVFKETMRARYAARIARMSAAVKNRFLQGDLSKLKEGWPELHDWIAGRLAKGQRVDPFLLRKEDAFEEVWDDITHLALSNVIQRRIDWPSLPASQSLMRPYAELFAKIMRERARREAESVNGELRNLAFRHPGATVIPLLLPSKGLVLETPAHRRDALEKYGDLLAPMDRLRISSMEEELPDSYVEDLFFLPLFSGMVDTPSLKGQASVVAVNSYLKGMSDIRKQDLIRGLIQKRRKTANFSTSKHLEGLPKPPPKVLPRYTGPLARLRGMEAHAATYFGEQEGSPSSQAETYRITDPFENRVLPVGGLGVRIRSITPFEFSRDRARVAAVADVEVILPAGVHETPGPQPAAIIFDVSADGTLSHPRVAMVPPSIARTVSSVQKGFFDQPIRLTRPGEAPKEYKCVILDVPPQGDIRAQVILDPWPTADFGRQDFTLHMGPEMPSHPAAIVPAGPSAGGTIVQQLHADHSPASLLKRFHDLCQQAAPEAVHVTEALAGYRRALEVLSFPLLADPVDAAAVLRSWETMQESAFVLGDLHRLMTAGLITGDVFGELTAAWGNLNARLSANLPAADAPAPVTLALPPHLRPVFYGAFEQTSLEIMDRLADEAGDKEIVLIARTKNFPLSAQDMVNLCREYLRMPAGVKVSEEKILAMFDDADFKAWARTKREGEMKDFYHGEQERLDRGDLSDLQDEKVRKWVSDQRAKQRNVRVVSNRVDVFERVWLTLHLSAMINGANRSMNWPSLGYTPDYFRPFAEKLAEVQRRYLEMFAAQVGSLARALDTPRTVVIPLVGTVEGLFLEGPESLARFRSPEAALLLNPSMRAVLAEPGPDGKLSDASVDNLFASPIYAGLKQMSSFTPLERNMIEPNRFVAALSRDDLIDLTQKLIRKRQKEKAVASEEHYKLLSPLPPSDPHPRPPLPEQRRGLEAYLAMVHPTALEVENGGREGGDAQTSIWERADAAFVLLKNALALVDPLAVAIATVEGLPALLGAIAGELVQSEPDPQTAAQAAEFLYRHTPIVDELKVLSELHPEETSLLAVLQGWGGLRLMVFPGQSGKDTGEAEKNDGGKGSEAVADSSASAPGETSGADETDAKDVFDKSASEEEEGQDVSGKATTSVPGSSDTEQAEESPLRDEPAPASRWAPEGFQVRFAEEGPSVDLAAGVLSLKASDFPKNVLRDMREHPADLRRLNALARRFPAAAEGVRLYFWERASGPLWETESEDVIEVLHALALERMEKEMDALLNGALKPEEICRVLKDGREGGKAYLRDVMSKGLSTWSQVLMVLEEYPDLVEELVVDLDDTLLAPVGYLGSEAWLRSELRKRRGASGLRAQKRHEEAWLMTHRAFGELEPGVAHRLAALRKKGLRIRALTARGAEDRQSTEVLLRDMGLPIDVHYAGNHHNKRASLRRWRDAKPAGGDRLSLFVDDRADSLLKSGLEPETFARKSIMAFHYLAPRRRAFPWEEAQAEFDKAMRRKDARAAALWATDCLIRLKNEVDHPDLRYLFSMEAHAFLSGAALPREDQERVSMAWIESVSDLLARGLHAGLSPPERDDLLRAYFGLLAPSNPEAFVEAFQSGRVTVQPFTPPPGFRQSMESGYELVLDRHNAYLFLEPLLRVLRADPPEVLILPETGALPFLPLLQHVIEKEGLPTRLVRFPVSQHAAADTPYELKRWLRLAMNGTLVAETAEDKALVSVLGKDAFEGLRGKRVMVLDDNVTSGLTLRALKDLLTAELQARDVPVLTPFAYRPPDRYPFLTHATVFLKGIFGWKATAEARGPPLVVRMESEFDGGALRGAAPRSRFQSPPARTVDKPEGVAFMVEMLDAFERDYAADVETSKTRPVPAEISPAPADDTAAGAMRIEPSSHPGLPGEISLDGPAQGWSLRPGRLPDGAEAERLFSREDAASVRAGVGVYEIVAPEARGGDRTAGFLLLIPAREEEGGDVFILQKIQPRMVWDGALPADQVVRALERHFASHGQGLLMPTEAWSMEGLSESHRVRRELQREFKDRRRFPGELNLSSDMERWVGSLNVISKPLTSREKLLLAEGTRLLQEILPRLRSLEMSHKERKAWRWVRRLLERGEPPTERELTLLETLARRTPAETAPSPTAEEDEDEAEAPVQAEVEEEEAASPGQRDSSPPPASGRDVDQDWRDYLSYFYEDENRSHDLAQSLNENRFDDFSLLGDYLERFDASLLKLLDHLTGEPGVYVLQGSGYSVDRERPVRWDRLERFLAGSWWAVAPGTDYLVIGSEPAPARLRRWFREHVGHTISFEEDVNHGLVGRVKDPSGETVDWIVLDRDPGASVPKLAKPVGGPSLGVVDIARWRRGEGGKLQLRLEGGSSAVVQAPPRGQFSLFGTGGYLIPLARRERRETSWTVRMSLQGNLLWPNGGQLVMDEYDPSVGKALRRLNVQALNAQGVLSSARTAGARDNPAAYHALMRMFQRDGAVDAPVGTYLRLSARPKSGDLYIGRSDLDENLVGRGIIPTRSARTSSPDEETPAALFGVEVVQDPERGVGVVVWKDVDGAPDRSAPVASFFRPSPGAPLERTRGKNGGRNGGGFTTDSTYADAREMGLTETAARLKLAPWWETFDVHQPVDFYRAHDTRGMGWWRRGYLVLGVASLWSAGLAPLALGWFSGDAAGLGAGALISLATYVFGVWGNILQHRKALDRKGRPAVGPPETAEARDLREALVRATGATPSKALPFLRERWSRYTLFEKWVLSIGALLNLPQMALHFALNVLSEVTDGRLPSFSTGTRVRVFRYGELVASGIPEEEIEKGLNRLARANDWSVQAEWIRMNAKRDDAFLAVNENGHLDGFLILDKNGYIPFLAVKRSSRRQGIGRSLFRSAVREAKSRGINRISLHYEAGDKRLVRFYAALGSEARIVKDEDDGFFDRKSPRHFIVYDLLAAVESASVFTDPGGLSLEKASARFFGPKTPEAVLAEALRLGEDDLPEYLGKTDDEDVVNRVARFLVKNPSLVWEAWSLLGMKEEGVLVRLVPTLREARGQGDAALAERLLLEALQRAQVLRMDRLMRMDFLRPFVLRFKKTAAESVRHAVALGLGSPWLRITDPAARTLMAETARVYGLESVPFASWRTAMERAPDPVRAAFFRDVRLLQIPSLELASKMDPARWEGFVDDYSFGGRAFHSPAERDAWSRERRTKLFNFLPSSMGTNILESDRQSIVDGWLDPEGNFYTAHMRGADVGPRSRFLDEMSWERGDALSRLLREDLSQAERVLGALILRKISQAVRLKVLQASKTKAGLDVSPARRRFLEGLPGPLYASFMGLLRQGYSVGAVGRRFDRLLADLMAEPALALEGREGQTGVGAGLEILPEKFAESLRPEADEGRVPEAGADFSLTPESLALRTKEDPSLVRAALESKGLSSPDGLSARDVVLSGARPRLVRRGDDVFFYAVREQDLPRLLGDLGLTPAPPASAPVRLVAEVLDVQPWALPDLLEDIGLREASVRLAASFVQDPRRLREGWALTRRIPGPSSDFSSVDTAAQRLLREALHHAHAIRLDGPHQQPNFLSGGDSWITLLSPAARAQAASLAREYGLTGVPMHEWDRVMEKRPQGEREAFLADEHRPALFIEEFFFRAHARGDWERLADDYGFGERAFTSAAARRLWLQKIKRLAAEELMARMERGPLPLRESDEARFMNDVLSADGPFFLRHVVLDLDEGVRHRYLENAGRDLWEMRGVELLDALRKDPAQGERLLSRLLLERIRPAATIAGEDVEGWVLRVRNVFLHFLRQGHAVWSAAEATRRFLARLAAETDRPGLRSALMKTPAASLESDLLLNEIRPSGAQVRGLREGDVPLMVESLDALAAEKPSRLRWILGEARLLSPSPLGPWESTIHGVTLPLVREGADRFFFAADPKAIPRLLPALDMTTRKPTALREPWRDMRLQELRWLSPGLVGPISRRYDELQWREEKASSLAKARQAWTARARKGDWTLFDDADAPAWEAPWGYLEKALGENPNDVLPVWIGDDVEVFSRALAAGVNADLARLANDPGKGATLVDGIYARLALLSLLGPKEADTAFLEKLLVALPVFFDALSPEASKGWQRDGFHSFERFQVWAFRLEDAGKRLSSEKRAVVLEVSVNLAKGGPAENGSQTAALSALAAAAERLADEKREPVALVVYDPLNEAAGLGAEEILENLMSVAGMKGKERILLKGALGGRLTISAATGLNGLLDGGGRIRSDALKRRQRLPADAVLFALNPDHWDTSIVLSLLAGAFVSDPKIAVHQDVQTYLHIMLQA